MATTKELRRRIKTASNISKITKAMEAVSASKMKKAQHIAMAGMTYEQLIKKMAEHITRFSNTQLHPLLSVDSDTEQLPVLNIVISPDRGLCGSLHTNVFRLAEEKIATDSLTIIVGKKTIQYARRTEWNVVAQLEVSSNYPTFQESFPISTVALEEFKARRVGSICLIYPAFLNTLVQIPTHKRILPLKMTSIPGENILRPTYIFEPSGRELLDDLLPAYVRLSVYQALLSMKAAEHSARMVAMRNASDNADGLKSLLGLIYNQNRQKSITSEISDIVTATMALG